jgi:hypothetical protein
MGVSIVLISSLSTAKLVPQSGQNRDLSGADADPQALHVILFLTIFMLLLYVAIHNHTFFL